MLGVPFLDVEPKASNLTALNHTFSTVIWKEESTLWTFHEVEREHLKSTLPLDFDWLGWGGGMGRKYRQL